MKYAKGLSCYFVFAIQKCCVNYENTMNTPTSADPEPSSPSADSTTQENSTNLFSRLISQWRKPDAGDEFEELLDAHDEDKENLSDDEKLLISAALEFDDLTADDACLPRADIVAVPATASFNEIWHVFVEQRKSRLPVYGENLDDIVGLIGLKDLLPFTNGSGKKAFKMNEVIRPVTFVPTTMTLPRVLKQMRKDRTTLVLVADEYGGTTGLLTLKDLVAELIGDVHDEHNEARSDIRQLSPISWEADARIDIDDLAAFLNASELEELADDEIESLGGLLAKIAGHIPQQGESFQLLPTLQADIISADARRVLRVKLLKLKAQNI